MQTTQYQSAQGKTVTLYTASHGYVTVIENEIVVYNRNGDALHGAGSLESALDFIRGLSRAL